LILRELIAIDELITRIDSVADDLNSDVLDYQVIRSGN